MKGWDCPVDCSHCGDEEHEVAELQQIAFENKVEDDANFADRDD